MDRFLIHAANHLRRELSLHPERSDPLRTRRQLRIACDALRRIDDELRPQGSLARAVRFLGARRRDHHEECRFLVEDLGAFTDVFLSQESKSLIQSGLKPEVANLIIEEAVELRNQLESFEYAPEGLRDRLGPLLQDVCQASDHFVDVARNDKRSFLERSAWITLGAVVIGVNGTADIATTGGMLPAATAVSGGLGGAIMGKGF